MNDNFSFNYNKNIKKENKPIKIKAIKKIKAEDYNNKKKKKKNKELKPEDNLKIPFNSLTNIQKFKRLWHNDRYKAMIKLSIYMIFIFVIIIVINILPNNTNNTLNDEKNENNTLTEEKNYNNYNYSSTLTYIENEEEITINYEGDRIEDENVGIKSFGDEITNYHIKNDVYYLVRLESTKIVEEKEIFERLDSKYFDLEVIKDYIEKGKLDYTTTYSNGVIVREYKIFLKDILLNYLEEDYFTIIEYTEEESLQYKIDYTNIINKENEFLEEIKLQIRFSNIGKVSNFSK